MENTQNQVPEASEATEKPISQEEMFKVIYDNTRKTMNYMKWQLYITIILVVLPLLATVILIPIALKGLSSAYLAPLQGIQ